MPKEAGQFLGIGAESRHTQTTPVFLNEAEDLNRFFGLRPPRNSESPGNQSNPAPEESIPQSPPTKISVAYDGILSQQLDWRQPVLDEFAKRTDLETQVIIKRGDSRPQTNYTVIGETLAWRRFANPLDIFASLLKRRKDVETIASSQIARAEIRVHDQIIADEVRNQTDRFSSKQFVDHLNVAVKKGLADINRWEKKQALKLVLTIDGILVTIAGITLGTAYGGVSLLADGITMAGRVLRSSYEKITTLSQNPSSLSGRMDPMESLYIVYLLAIGAGISLVSIRGASGLIDCAKAIRTSRVNPSDFNPLKPIWDWAKGTMYLKFGPKEVVRLHSTD